MSNIERALGRIEGKIDGLEKETKEIKFATTAEHKEIKQRLNKVEKWQYAISFFAVIISALISTGIQIARYVFK